MESIENKTAHKGDIACLMSFEIYARQMFIIVKQINISCQVGAFVVKVTKFYF